MSNWRAFPNQSWVPIGKILSGFGLGEGSYESAYTLDEEIIPFLNGRVSASFRLAEDKIINGAGVVARADKLRSYLAFYVVTDDTSPDLYSICKRSGGLN